MRTGIELLRLVISIATTFAALSQSSAPQRLRRPTGAEYCYDANTRRSNLPPAFRAGTDSEMDST